MSCLTEGAGPDMPAVRVFLEWQVTLKRPKRVGEGQSEVASTSRSKFEIFFQRRAKRSQPGLRICNWKSVENEGYRRIPRPLLYLLSLDGTITLVISGIVGFRRSQGSQPFQRIDIM